MNEFKQDAVENFIKFVIFHIAGIISLEGGAKRFVPGLTQHERFSKIKSTNVLSNADMRVGEVRLYCKLDEAGRT